MTLKKIFIELRNNKLFTNANFKNAMEFKDCCSINCFHVTFKSKLHSNQLHSRKIAFDEFKFFLRWLKNYSILVLGNSELVSFPQQQSCCYSNKVD